MEKFMQLPQIRMARIKKLVKYNTTNSASNVVWAWRETLIEQIQYLNEHNEWLPLPVVDIYDDSDKQKEEQDKINHINKIKEDNKKLLILLDTVEDLTTYWYAIDMATKLSYILDYEKARFDFNSHDDGFHYYSNQKGFIARSKNNEHFVRGDILQSFLIRYNR